MRDETGSAFIPYPSLAAAAPPPPTRECAPQPSPFGARLLRSLITLKALTYAPTSGLVAAATTSLPEQLGGVRNWDYH
jgi:GH15 family glucan-1,4-alpha-glucosidase